MVTTRLSEYRRMAQQTTKVTSTAAILLALASIAQAEGPEPFFSYPPPSISSQIDWSGNVDAFQFVSNEGQRSPEGPSAPHEYVPTGSFVPPSSGARLAGRQGWPPEPPTGHPVSVGQPAVSQPTSAQHPPVNGEVMSLKPDQNAIQKDLAAPNVDHGHSKVADTYYSMDNNRMFVQLDLLTWAISPPDITTIGDLASEDFVTVGGNTYFRRNSLNTSFITSDWSEGGRIDLGRIEDQRGWMGSVLFYRHRDEVTANGVWFVPNDPDGLLRGYQDSNNDGVDDDVDNDQIYGRSGQDLGTPDNTNPGTFVAPFDGTIDQPAPTDTGDLVGWLVTFSTLTASNRVELTGFELMDVLRPHGNGQRTLDWFYGLRYLEFREKFGVVATGGVLDSSMWNMDSDNDIIGPQIGLRWAANQEWFRFTAEGRFLAGANFQGDRLNGTIGSNVTGGGVNGPVAFEPHSFNALQNNTEFSPVGEWRLEASYYAASWLAFRIGYTGMAIGGVSRASQKVAYTLPSFGLSDVGSNETILVNGLTIGLEINR